MGVVSDRYFDEILARISDVRQRLAVPMARAVELIVAAAKADKRLFIYGTGHSHLLAEELHFRAGGLAITVPIDSPGALSHHGAVTSGAYERLSGLIAPIFERYGVGAGDIVLVISNSGINAMPLEAAKIGRQLGAKIIALTSLAYSRHVAQRDGKTREILADLADIVLDNGGPPGDAVIALEGSDLKTGPISTVIGATILNAIMVDVAQHLAVTRQAPIYLSANMKGAAEINRQLITRFRPRNPHL